MKLKTQIYYVQSKLKIPNNFLCFGQNQRNSMDLQTKAVDFA